MEALEFHLNHFDGPMDLLMHLLEKNRIDVYDIPINELTDQYLMYLEEAKRMNLEIASHFVLFAAQLVRIKVRMLLPKRKQEEAEEDPRKELVDQIVAYKFFKELSHDLEEIQSTCAHYHARQVDLSRLREKYQRAQVPKDLPVEALLKAFQVLEAYSQEKAQVMVIEKNSFSIEVLREKLLDFCQASSRPTFQGVLRQCLSVDEMITFFLALLECIRQNEITVEQDALFDDIRLHPQAV
ncbi:MAG: segregation/condensation protein A [Peptococcaceae bacterium]|nr:segregation/condensation protein A [Peptococcaceae bacterium]